MECKISILIPVYNAERYLRACLDSVFSQTLKDIEVICVDDGSTDSSAAILSEYRLKHAEMMSVIALPANEGLARARFHGIQAAGGQYIMFLDSDDYLEPKACQIAYREIRKNNYDIVNFGANVIAECYLEKNQLQYSEKYFSAKSFSLFGEDILRDCFEKQRYNWNLWTKIYRADLVKSVVKYIPTAKCVMAEDLMIYFFIAFYAGKFKSIPDNLVDYRLGNGASTQEVTLNSYISHLGQNVALQGINDFIVRNDVSQDPWVSTILDHIREHIEVDLVDKYVRYVSLKDGGPAFDEFLKHFDVLAFIKGLSKIDKYNRSQLMAKVAKSEFVKTRTAKNIKTIGIFYYRYNNGGVERVISKLMPLLLKLGYRVVFFKEQKANVRDFKIPSAVTTVILPASSYVTKENYLIHAAEFKMQLIRNHIDIMLYQASVALYLFEEMLICKSLDIPFVVTTHDFYSATVLAQDTYMLQKRIVYSMCDAVQTITQDEEYAWKQMGVKAKYIPNPLTFNPQKIAAPRLDNHDIGWVGRIDYKQKCPEYAVKALKYVKEAIPDVKLHIIGTAEDDDDKKYLQQLIHRYGLTANVELHGFVSKPEKLYPNFSCYLMTSSYEVYPMSLGEAMAYGLPVVLFDLPYVELLKDTSCYLSAPQMDVKQLANNIIKVLTDADKRKQMSDDARKKINEVAEFDLEKAWKLFLREIGEGTIDCAKNLSLATIVDITYQHWARSLNRKNSTPDHPDNYLCPADKRFKVIDTLCVDKRVLYGLLLRKKSRLFKAFYFFFFDPKLFWKKVSRHFFKKSEKSKKKQ